MAGIDWVGLIAEAVARYGHYTSDTEAGLNIPVDRQTWRRWAEGFRGTPRGLPKRALLEWAQRELPEERQRELGVLTATSNGAGAAQTAAVRRAQKARGRKRPSTGADEE